MSQTHFPVEDKCKCRIAYKRHPVKSKECSPVYGHLIYHREDNGSAEGEMGFSINGAQSIESQSGKK